MDSLMDVPARDARPARDPSADVHDAPDGESDERLELAAREPVRLAGLPAPWDGLDWRRLVTERNEGKAVLGVAERDGAFVVCKDRTRALAGLRGVYARWAHRNETRALAALDGVVGIPRLLASWPAGLVMTRLPGVKLRDLPRRGVPESVLGQLEAIVDEIHARGFVVGDIHRNNVLVDDAGEVGLVDFENALDVRTGWRRIMRRRLLALDRYCIAKIRQQLGLPLDESQGRALDGPMARVSRVGRAWRTWVHDRKRARGGRQRAR
ncbi:MAG: phosphotransferase [Planctomycetes bacterium]|nr:phosphotransferase [Planctomycetota bacterium]